MTWIQNNLPSMLAGLGLLLILALAVTLTNRGKKKEGSCGLGCAACHCCGRAQEHGGGE